MDIRVQNSVFEHFLFLKRQETSNKSECAKPQHQDLYNEAEVDTKMMMKERRRRRREESSLNLNVHGMMNISEEGGC